MFTIRKSFRFEAAHRISGLPADHKCGRLHGHSYTVEVVVSSSDLVPPGFVVDFADLAPLGEYLAATFDHRDLTEVLDVAPTSENLAWFLYEWCQENLPLPGTVQLTAVRVGETASTYAEYAPVDGRS
ncbi:6-carboxytetrahydropterin synthase [Solwaraspora sp. WMMD791]|uniref:6-pyruvoyl trahydropterin synthase family protein n=1 Tax=Solwaraspora sp. WMMD791 TaxID=3016086 RepID=UPI00249AD131|nr:6-carboxytetrahydropterin synthase [Solwaraspora sp. WMMD791]WFE27685.1 6-carboxytetrahydropterin synthase [Solwaraspora sp. WMMD791]